MVRKDINDEIRRSISYIQDELQISIEKNTLEGRKREKFILVAWWWTEAIAHYESYGKTFKKMNKTSENMTYLIYNKTFLCQHNKLHPLTARRGKLDIRNIV